MRPWRTCLCECRISGPCSHIFKAAELRLDAEIYGLLILPVRENPGKLQLRLGIGLEFRTTASSWPLVEQQKKPDTTYAYSNRTRQYFRTRNVRTLRRAGELGDAATFITLATGVLMAYDDENDRHPTRIDSRYTWASGNWSTIETHYDDFANYLGAEFLALRKQPRYGYKRGAPCWHCAGSYEPGQPAPSKREEAYPKLWDQAPDALKHLLSHSRCGRVHEFAAKVWKANHRFCRTRGLGFHRGDAGASL